MPTFIAVQCPLCHRDQVVKRGQNGPWNPALLVPESGMLLDCRCQHDHFHDWNTTPYTSLDVVRLAVAHAKGQQR